MLKFYYHGGTPNPRKVALFLEESGLDYEIVPVDIFKGQQHSAAYKAINPNAKVPSIVDDGVTVFDSNAILLYLAEKTRKFLPPDDPSNRGQLLSWLMFIASGVGPYSGQAAHFKAFAPEQLPYAINRYRSEASRHYGILDERLKDRQYLLGDDYTIVDMAAWAWGIMVPVLLDAAAWELLPNFKRLIDAVSARPAAVRVMAMQAQHKFKHELDSEARSALFPTSQH